MVKCAGSKVRPSRRPGPATRTRLASPSSAWLMVTEMGLRARGCPPPARCAPGAPPPPAARRRYLRGRGHRPQDEGMPSAGEPGVTVRGRRRDGAGGFGGGTGIQGTSLQGCQDEGTRCGDALSRVRGHRGQRRRGAGRRGTSGDTAQPFEPAGLFTPQQRGHGDRVPASPRPSVLPPSVSPTSPPSAAEALEPAGLLAP